MNLSVIIFSTLSIITLSIGSILFKKLKTLSSPNNRLEEVSQLIHDGLLKYMARLSSSMLQIFIYTAIVLLLFSHTFNKPFSWVQISSFLIAECVMLLNTFISLQLIPKLIPKIIEKSKDYVENSLTITYQAGVSVVFMTIGITLLGLVICEIGLGPKSIIGYGLGLAFAAFFLRIGGGLYKSGSYIADKTLELLEKKLPHFDPRNPGVILELIGDYLGKVIGFSSDLLSSFIFSLISCLLFSRALLEKNFISIESAKKLFSLPYYVISVSLFLSLIVFGLTFLRIKSKSKDNFLLEGLYFVTIGSGIATYLIISYLNIQIDTIKIWGYSSTFHPYIPYLTGLIGAVFISFTSEYLTSNRYNPAKEVAKKAEFGPATILLNCFAIGLQGNGIYLLYLLFIGIPSFFYAGFYGIAMASLGMLSVTPTILTLNIFSPLASSSLKLLTLTKKTDNHSETTIKNIRKASSIGATTQALGNSFAAGTSAIATLSLFFTFALFINLDFKVLFLVDLKLLTGLVIGITLPYVFSGLLLRKLSQFILFIRNEILRQFSQIPFLLEDKSKPDIRKASDDLSRYSMDAMIFPGILMVLTPILTGYIFGSKMLLGLSLGTILSGVNQSFYWATVGDISNNAKLHIETGYFGGKESQTFQHASTIDTFGSAYKDLLSPSMNILIKSVTIISILVIVLINL